MKPELIIFDMDGLMFDTERIAYKSYRLAAEQFGYTIDEDLYNLTLGVNKNGTEVIYKEHLGDDFPFEDVYTIRARISDEMIEEGGVPIQKGLYKLLDYLKTTDIKLAVATSTNRQRAIHHLELAKVIDYFECVVCGDEVTHSKPDPEIFLKAAAHVGCTSKNIIVLEDSQAGIRAASAAGMKPVMVPDILQPTEETKQRLFKQLDDLSQVIGLVETM